MCKAIDISLLFSRSFFLHFYLKNFCLQCAHKWKREGKNCSVASVMFNSVWPHRRQPTRLPHPWDSPGKNTEWVAISFSNASEVAQSCPTLNDPMDCSLPGSSIHGIFQARVLEWVAYLFSSRSSQLRNQTGVSCIAGGFFTDWAIMEALNKRRIL